MDLIRSLVMAGVLVGLVGCRSDTSKFLQDPQIREPIRIQLNGSNPAASEGVLDRAEGPLRFTVGHGRHGIGCQGTTFEEGVTPLGTFQVNAILSNDRFEMDPSLVEQSGKTEEELRETLFTNMNSIDFKGDGETGEYGTGYISLAPVPATDQPFRFNIYDGVFRWYSFAIHGTNDETRIGKAVTGGCINTGQLTMGVLLDTVELGDEVVISSDSPCLP
ncbi:L,D-transpeptidase [Synechococcus sp. HB1133]|uniref:L,D-transpeptidase n=1 Tax=unclassified Synechococcus TaxID=2626047 RepID=UPI00140DC2CE|nr:MULTISPECIES: L,D-transpeptidase [unclassified Synechococcus]MCB4394715.1 L,D-transpeptidase [Synechococcus sp. PH41509]MCB4422058.1 L,D-transpeptidase [Synechococcus sp. HB1133]MCB4429994.1 L,D-transpeptidase [Synechococcus sp. HBA1120]NHI81001.1 L,D-transpeptidase [Synechococcus sp. HB1133]